MLGISLGRPNLAFQFGEKSPVVIEVITRKWLIDDHINNKLSRDYDV
jgi:hypothetical protein